jgi:hypothetical protein
MAIKRPDIYEHQNPNEPIADTDFVKGGFRTKVADLTALYALAPKVNQMKEHATSVWVISEAKYYTLVDASNVGNSGGWSDSVLGSDGGGTWGSITGTLSDQTDLQAALDLKLDKNNNIFLEESTNISTSADWNNMSIDIDNQDASFNLVINHVVKFTVTKLKAIGIITITAGVGITLFYKNTVQEINGGKGSMAFIKPDPTTANQLIVYITN